ELINGLEEGKVSLAGAALQAGLLAVGHFFGQQKSEKVAIGPGFFLGSIRYLLVDAACVRQVETPRGAPFYNAIASVIPVGGVESATCQCSVPQKSAKRRESISPARMA
ncbi:MAG: hypothetical protein WAL65_21015, partial [Candidatus Sulfotelmatobacter sp.]